MKLLVIALIFLCTLFFGSARLRLFITLAGIAVVIGLCFGPPEYVVFKDKQTVISSDGEQVVAYQAWELTRLLPVEAMADKVLYSPELDLSEPIDDSRLAAAFAPFAIPGGQASRFLWVILAFGVLVSYRGVVFSYTTARNLAAAKRSFEESVRRDTVNAYEEFLDKTEEGLFSPRRLRKKAEERRLRVYEKYVRRMQLLRAVNDRHVETLNSQNAQEALIANAQSSSRFCDIVVSILENNRDTGKRELPYKVSVSPKVYLRGRKAGFDSIEEMVDFKIQQDSVEWANAASEFHLTKIEQLHPSLGDIIDQAASEIRKTNSWMPAEQVLNRCLVSLDEQLQENPAFQRKRPQLLNILKGSLLNRITLRLPIKDAYSSYSQLYGKNIDRILADTFSRFFPDELLDGEGKGLFRRNLGAPANVLGLLRVDLLAEGQIFSGGTISFSGRYHIQHQGSLGLLRQGQLNSKRQTKVQENQIPIIQAIDSAVSAFSPPSPPKISQRTSAVPTDEDSIRKVFKEFDDLVKDFAKGTAEDVLLDFMIDQFSDEITDGLQTMTAVISDQLKLQEDNAIEFAAEVAGTLILGDDEE